MFPVKNFVLKTREKMYTVWMMVKGEHVNREELLSFIIKYMTVSIMFCNAIF